MNYRLIKLQIFKIFRLTSIVSVSFFAAAPVLAVDIEGVYELALSSDHVIRKAKMIRAGSQEVVQQSRARFWPKISVSTFYTQKSQDRTVHAFNSTTLIDSRSDHASNGYNVSVTQSLFDYDAIVNRQQAWLIHELADIKYNQADHHLVLRVITAYLGVLAAREDVRYRDLEVQALKKQFDHTKYRVTLGVSAEIDVSEAKAGYDQAQARRTTAKIRLSIAHEALREITGQLHSDLDPLRQNVHLGLPVPNNIARWIETAHENNEQLREAESQLKIARMGVKRQRTSRYPNLSLIAAYNYYDDLALDFVGVKLETRSITARVNWNFYQGGAIHSRIRQARFYKEQLDIALQQQKNLIERQVRDAYYILVGGVTRLGELRQSILSQEAVLRANKVGYETGTRTSFNLLTARTTLYSLRRKLAQARHDNILHHAVLKYHAGVLRASDLEEINQDLERAS